MTANFTSEATKIMLEVALYFQRKRNVKIIYSTLFIAVKTWKLSKYISVGEWLNKFWYINLYQMDEPQENHAE